jgi:cytoskeletal protein CcmA (bactofilin family)
MFTKKPDPDAARNAALAASKPLSPMPAASLHPGIAARPVSPVGGKSIPSTIGPDLTIMGNLVSDGEVIIDGQVQGDINCGHLTVGEQAVITGGIIAKEVVVRGRVMGSIRGNSVNLQTKSHVEGDIYHQSLSIEQGALFEGRSRRSDDPMGANTAKDTAPGTPLNGGMPLPPAAN